MTLYSVTSAPRGASMRSWDCAFCDATDLRRPVFLDGPFGVVAAGSTCAASMVFGVAEPSARDMLAIQKLRTSADHHAREAEEVRLGRLGIYTGAVHEWAAERARLAAGVQEWQGDRLAIARTTYHQLGGQPALGVNFPTFLIAVALTGLLPEAP